MPQSHHPRTRSQNALGGFVGQGKKSKKRVSAEGVIKHTYPTRSSQNSYTRTALGDVTNRGNNNVKRAKQENLNKPNLANIQSNQTISSIQQGQQHPVILPGSSANCSQNDDTHTLKIDVTVRHDTEILDSFDLSNEESDVNMERLDCEEQQEEMKRDEDEILKIDAADIDNPQAVSEYIQDIMVYFRDVEEKGHPTPGYMDSQRDINSKMREILIDWLSEVHLKFKLRPETMYLTVNLIDRFLSKRPVSRTKLQLVGCTAMLVASKYEEIYAPEVRDFVFISDKAYTREQILMMEAIVLNTLQFNLTVPSALRFGQRYLKLVKCADARFKMLVQYLMELTLQSYVFLKYLPSKIAASAVYVALGVMSSIPGKPEWTNLLRSQTNYTEEQLKNCVKTLQEFAAQDPQKYRAVRKKYASRKFLEVAKIPVPLLF